MKMFWMKIVSLLIIIGHEIDCQSSVNLGIFDAPFLVVLTDNPSSESTTTMMSATTVFSDNPTTGTTTTTTSSSSSSSTTGVTSLDIVSTATVAAATATSTTVTTVATTGTTYHPSINLTQEIISELQPLLNAAFASTTGFMLLTKARLYNYTGSQLTFQYDVIYNKTLLSEIGFLASNSEFLEQLRNATSSIVHSNHNFTSGFEVDKNLTETDASNSIAMLNVSFNNFSWLCSGAVCPTSTDTCYLNQTSNKADCIDICQQFETRNSCNQKPSVSGVYLRGTCQLDSHNNPYCDCGTSPGDVMHNFYDGTQCVSVTFIVAMATCAGGFFFLLLLVAICIICAQSRPTTTSSSKSSSSSQQNAVYNNDQEEGYEIDTRSNNPYGSHKFLYEVNKEQTPDGYTSIRL